MATITDKEPPLAGCTERIYHVTAADLPLACPPLTVRVWDGHPRVYLPIEGKEQVRCPYCSALYIKTTD